MINFGILPIEIDIEADLLDEINVKFDRNTIVVKNITKNKEYSKDCDLSDEEYKLIECGGLLNTF